MANARPLPVPGAFYEVRYPFIREPYESWGAEGPITLNSWRPGTRFEQDGRDEDHYAVADGDGTMVMTVVSVHKPGRYPTRIFYLRHWRDPDGKAFGRGKLRAAIANHFHALTNGYRHDYELVANPPSSTPI